MSTKSEMITQVHRRATQPAYCRLRVDVNNDRCDEECIKKLEFNKVMLKVS